MARGLATHAQRRTPAIRGHGRRARSITLLDLVAAAADSASTDAEVVATVAHIVASGRVRLIGGSRERHVQLR